MSQRVIVEQALAKVAFTKETLLSAAVMLLSELREQKKKKTKGVNGRERQKISRRLG